MTSSSTYRDEWNAVARTIEPYPVFSDHEHHHPDAFFREPMTLDRLFANSYVAWTRYVPDGTRKSREALIEHVRFNSYYTWMEQGIQRIHGFTDPIHIDNWETLSATIGRAYAGDPDFHWKTLHQFGYERLLLDAFWNPGDDNGHPELFTPVFRIDKFMYGVHAEAIAPNEFCTWSRYGFNGGTLADYVDLMHTIIRKRHQAGQVAALKCADAYFRSISFQPDDPEAARAAFGRHPSELTPEQRMAFGNYIFNRACELAAELDIPFQVHTGLALLSGSEPMKFEPTIARHPKTRFVLFHSGYPWIHQVAGLAHNYPNALPSLTWTATISTSAAVRALHEFIDVAPSIRTITWGSDCFHAEESIGALLAWKWIVTTVLSERLCDGRLHARDLEPLARNLLHANGRSLYLHQG